MYLDEINKLMASIKKSTSYQITMLGDKGIIVEGHGGIKSYSDTNILLKVHNNYILINGNYLHINEINDIDILIDGDIDKVELHAK